MVMRFHGGGVGHKSTHNASDWFKQDRDPSDSNGAIVGNGPCSGKDNSSRTESQTKGGSNVESEEDEEENGDNDSSDEENDCPCYSDLDEMSGSESDIDKLESDSKFSE